MNDMDEFELEEKKKNGKGFYIALAVCAVAVCGIALTTFLGSLPTDEPKMENVTSSTTRKTTTTTSAQAVVKPQDDVPDTRTTTTAATTTKAPQPLYILPSSNRVLRPFSELHAYSETLGAWVTHNGVDFSAEKDSEVKAVSDGKVKGVYEDVLWGHIVETEHSGNLIIRYCGVKSTLTAGQAIKMGDVIGTLADVPAEITDKPHLHLEMLVNGNYLDPMTLIQGEIVTE